MNKKIFIRAEEGEPPGISVVYYDTDGNKTIRYHDKNGKTYGLKIGLDQLIDLQSPCERA